MEIKQTYDRLCACDEIRLACCDLSPYSFQVAVALVLAYHLFIGGGAEIVKSFNLNA